MDSMPLNNKDFRRTWLPLLCCFAIFLHPIKGAASEISEIIKIYQSSEDMAILHGEIERIAGSATYTIRLSNIVAVYESSGIDKSIKDATITIRLGQMNQKLSLLFREQKKVLLVARKTSAAGKISFASAGDKSIALYVTEATPEAVQECKRSTVKK